MVTCSLAIGCVVYASINGELWAKLLEVERTIFDTGTLGIGDLSPWRNDMGMAWQEDLMLHEVTGVPDQYWQIGDRVWVPRNESAFPRCGLWGVAMAVLGLWAIGIVSPWIAYRTSGSSAWNGLELESVSGARSRICFGSTMIMLAALPLLFGLSWYLSYDRVQSSIDWESGQPRSFRLLFDSFRPRIREWIMIYAVYTAGLCFLCWVRFQRLLRSLPHDRVIAGRVRCPDRRCGYPFDRSIQKCPECGINWFAHHPGKAPLRRLNLGLKFGAGLVVIMIIASVIWSVTDWDRRYRLWNWLTLRGDHYHWQDLVLPPDRPVEVQWDEHTIWLVMLVTQVQELPGEQSFLAYSIDGGELHWYGVSDRIKHDDEWLMMGFRGWEDRKEWFKGVPGTKMGSIPIAKTPTALRVYQDEVPDEIAEWIVMARGDLEARTDEIFARMIDMETLDHEIP
ncbi:MAG: hypothetical protein ACX94C_00095 [Phycisphaerales bacterium]